MVAIAISLVNLNSIDILKLMMHSLLSSDIIDNKIKLFYWDNGSTDDSLDFVNNLEVNKCILLSNQNEGIVLPRIKLMDEIVKEEAWDYILEIHSDMLFPKSWFSGLSEFLTDDIGILMPYILQSKQFTYDMNELEMLYKKYKENLQIHNCLQVHPWLLNKNCISDVGYYKPEYKTHRCEDDDFLYRVFKSKYEIMATKTSIVFHQGGYLRPLILSKNKNEEIFYQLNGIELKNHLKTMRENGHPFISLDPSNGFQLLNYCQRTRTYSRKVFSGTR